jgi:thiosulfate dehydrogenase [quinone] large subunit
MSSDFAATPLPRFAVLSFGCALPFAELLVGILMFVGLWLRSALVAGSLLISALMFGTALKGDWNVLGTQLLYALVYYVLIAKRSDDTWSLDARGRPR